MNLGTKQDLGQRWKGQVRSSLPDGSAGNGSQISTLIIRTFRVFRDRQCRSLRQSKALPQMQQLSKESSGLRRSFISWRLPCRAVPHQTSRACTSPICSLKRWQSASGRPGQTQAFAGALTSIQSPRSPNSNPRQDQREVSASAHSFSLSQAGLALPAFWKIGHYHSAGQAADVMQDHHNCSCG